MDRKIEIYLRIKNTSDSIWEVAGDVASYSSDGKKKSIEGFNAMFYKETNNKIYRKAVQAAICRFKNGENVTIFAYGQTGSGKTYTMIGGLEKGLIQLALGDLLPGSLEVSFIELFNEKIFDLFTGHELKMYVSKNKTIIAGLHTQKVTTINGVIEFIEECLENRKSGTTNFNPNSSRSHAILQVKHNNEILTFIDLAGSERACNDDKRMKEAAFINRSLLALGTLVNNMLSNKSIGFRDSKLTRVLQNTITKRVTMLAFCTINSSRECLNESLSTLNFAARLVRLDLKLKEMAIENDDEVIRKDESLNFYKLNSENIKNEKIIFLQKQRIDELERQILNMLESVPNKSLSDAFLLEKQMYQINLENAMDETNENEEKT